MHELIGLNSNGDNQISGVTDSNMTQTVMKELQGEVATSFLPMVAAVVPFIV